MTGDCDWPAEAGTAFDPRVPGPARRRIARRRSRRHLRPGLLFILIVVCLTVITSTPRPGRGLDSAIMLAAAACFLLAGPARDTAAARTRHRYRDRFIGAADLDQPSRQLLLRAQAAIRAVLSSQVHQAGQLDDAANVTVLSAQEWDIARLLQDASRLRAEHGRISAAAPPQAPAVAEVAGPQREILRQVHDAVTARVEALEDYAARVRAADDAYRNWQHALALAGLNDGLLDLLARTAADGQAAEELDVLAGQAQAAEKTFRGTLSDARTAAGPVVLSVPPAQARPAPSAA
jgi:hypothetical protein